MEELWSGVEEIDGWLHTIWGDPLLEAIRERSYSRAYALLQGRDFVQTDDVQKLIEPVFVHRIILQSQAVFRQQTPELVLRSSLREIPVPNIR